MKSRRRGENAFDGADAKTSRPSRRRPIDLVHLARQTLGDRHLEREILDLMARQLDQCSARIDLATDAERSAIAHAVKGAARNVGAFALAQSAQDVEDRPADLAARSALAAEMTRAGDFIGTLLR